MAENQNNNSLYHFSKKVLALSFLFLFINLAWFLLISQSSIEVESKDVAPKVIFASNHSSEIDPILIPASLPFLSRLMPMFYVSRENKFYDSSGWIRHIYGGTFFKLWGAHPVGIAVNDYEKSLQTHIKILSSGKSLHIFPQGARVAPNGAYLSNGKKVVEKAGVAFLSSRASVPVVPVHIKGSFNTSFKNFLLRKNSIEITFNKPLYPKDIFTDINNIQLEDYKTATNKIMDVVRGN